MSGWRNVSLKYVATRITRGSAPIYAEQEEEGQALVIGQSCQRPDGTVELSRARRHASDAPVPAKGRVMGQEIVVNSTGTGTLGRVGLLPAKLDEPTFVDTHVTLIECDRTKAEPRYLARVLQLPNFAALAEQALSFGATKQRELDRQALRSHRVLLGSTDEQRRIADFLDDESARIAELRHRMKSLKSRLWESPLALADRELERWKQGAIHYRFDVQLGKMLDAARVDPGEVRPYLRNANVQWDRIELQDLKEMTFSEGERRKFELRSGDLLVCEGGEPGRCAVWNGELTGCYYQKALHRVRARGADSTRFLLWCLRALNRRGIFAVDGPGRYTHLTAEALRAVRIPLPTPDEQHRLAGQFDAEASRIRAIDDKIDRTGLRLAEYRDALITEAVTGHLDVTRVSDAQMDERARAAIEGELVA